MLRVRPEPHVTHQILITSAMSTDLDSLRASDWYCDDLKHVGVDFADPVQVGTCDARQRTTDAAASALLDERPVQSDQTLADYGCGTGVLGWQAALGGCAVHAGFDLLATLRYAHSEGYIRRMAELTRFSVLGSVRGAIQEST